MERSDGFRRQSFVLLLARCPGVWLRGRDGRSDSSDSSGMSGRSLGGEAAMIFCERITFVLRGDRGD